MDFFNDDQDPDSAELLMAQFEDDFEAVNSKSDDQPPFVTCDESYSDFSAKCNRSSGGYDAKIAYDKYEFSPTMHEDLQLLLNFLMQKIMEFSSSPSSQSTDGSLSDIGQCLQSLLSAFHSGPEELKPVIGSMIKTLNLALGELNYDHNIDLIHINLMFKWAFIDVACQNSESIFHWNSDYCTSLIVNIINLANVEFEHKQKSPFRCSCYKNLLLYCMNKMGPKLFWNFFVSLFSFEVQPTTEMTMTIQHLTFQSAKVSWSLYWFVVSHVIDDIGEFGDVLSASETHLKAKKNNVKSLKEVELALEALSKLATKTALTLEILYVLWDYFRDNLETNFDQGSIGSLAGFAVLPTKYEDYLAPAKAYRKNPLTVTFVKLIQSHLSHVSRPDKDLQRLLTRLRQRLQLQTLNQMGLHNFMSLFLRLYQGTSENAVLKTFLDIMEAALVGGQMAKNLMPMISQGIAASIVHLVSASDQYDLLQKSVDILVIKCVDFCLRGLNRKDAAFTFEVVTKVIKVYLTLLKDVRCFSCELFLSVPNLLSLLLLKHIERLSKDDRQDEASDIYQTLTSLVTKIRSLQAKTQGDALSETEAEIQKRIEENLGKKFKIDNDVLNIMDKDGLDGFVPKDRADFLMAIIRFNGYSDSVLKKLEQLLFKSKLPLTLELLNNLLQDDYEGDKASSCLEALFIRCWIRLEMRMDKSKRASSTASQLRLSMNGILDKRLGMSGNVLDLIRNLGQEVQKANYESYYLKKIMDDYKDVIEELTKTSDPPDFVDQFYVIAGECIEELAPVLWFDNQRLMRILSPLNSSLFKEDHLKSAMIKNYSKLLPKMLNGIVSAMPASLDLSHVLGNLVKDIMSNALKKIHTNELEPTFRLMFAPLPLEKSKFVTFRPRLQRLFLNELKLFDPSRRERHLLVLIKCLELSSNHGTSEVIVQRCLGNLLDIYISGGGNKDAVKSVITKCLGLSNISSSVIRHHYQARIAQYFASKYASLKEILFILKRQCPGIYKEIHPIIRIQVQNLAEKNPILARKAEADLLSGI